MNQQKTAHLNRHRGLHHRASALSFAALPSPRRGHPGRRSIAGHVVTFGGFEFASKLVRKTGVLKRDLLQ